MKTLKKRYLLFLLDNDDNDEKKYDDSGWVGYPALQIAFSEN